MKPADFATLLRRVRLRGARYERLVVERRDRDEDGGKPQTLLRWRDEADGDTGVIFYAKLEYETPGVKAEVEFSMRYEADTASVWQTEGFTDTFGHQVAIANAYPYLRAKLQDLTVSVGREQPQASLTFPSDTHLAMMMTVDTNSEPPAVAK